MKLLFCPHCHDIRRLFPDSTTTCRCGKSSGQYLADGVQARLRGDAIPLGILNSSFVAAIRDRPEEGLGERFEAFVIPVKCPTVSYE